MPIRSGDLDKRVTIERNVGDVRDAAGNYVPDWQPIRKCWASVRALGGSKPIFADQVHPATSHVVTIRYQPQMVSAGMRAVLANPNGTARILDIVSVVNDGELNESLILQCVEQVLQVPQAMVGANGVV